MTAVTLNTSPAVKPVLPGAVSAQALGRRDGDADRRGAALLKLFAASVTVTV